MSIKDGLDVERQNTVSMHQFETAIDDGDKIQVASQDSGVLANTESELTGTRAVRLQYSEI